MKAAVNFLLKPRSYSSQRVVRPQQSPPPPGVFTAATADKVQWKGNAIETHELNKRLHSFVRIHDYAKAMNVLEEMRRKHVTPDHVSYSRLLRMFTDKQDLQKALDTLWEMKDGGAVPSTPLANSVLHLYARKGDRDGIEQFFEEMNTKLEVIRDERSFLEIIRFFASLEDVDRAKYYHHKMKEEGLEPTLAVYTDLIWLFSKKHLYQDAVALYEEMKRHHLVRPDQVVLNMVLEIGVNTKNIPLIQETIRGLWDLGAEPHPEHYDAIRDL